MNSSSASRRDSSLLTQVPVELLLRITYYLSTPELGNVRLTCKALERSLFNFFSHEFFRKKQFMMFEDSLSALIEISKHPALAPFLVRRDLSTSGSRFVGQI